MGFRNSFHIIKGDEVINCGPNQIVEYINCIVEEKFNYFFHRTQYDDRNNRTNLHLKDIHVLFLRLWSHQDHRRKCNLATKVRLHTLSVVNIR